MSHGLVGPALIGPYINRVTDAVDIAARKLTGDHAPRGEKRKPLYTNVATKSCGMVVLMAFVLDAGAVAGLEIGEVGLGLNGMANKAAVGVRFSYKGTEMTFVSAHLAAMEWELERRNEDWKNIVKGLVLTPDGDAGSAKAIRENREGGDESRGLLERRRDYGIYKPTSHLFVAGDLNYRTNSMKPGPTDHIDTFPQPKHPASSPQHFSILLENDQLTAERNAGRTLHGLNEAPVTFPPTYKYNSHTHDLKEDEDIDDWGWATHRWPSWTDRILYLDLPPWLKREHPDARLKVDKYDSLPLFPTSDHKAVVLSIKVPLLPIPEPDEEDRDNSKDPRVNPPFDIEPQWRAKRSKARKEELVAGIIGFLTATWEGWCVVIGTIAGALGGYFLLRAALDL